MKKILIHGRNDKKRISPEPFNPQEDVINWWQLDTSNLDSSNRFVNLATVNTSNYLYKVGTSNITVDDKKTTVTYVNGGSLPKVYTTSSAAINPFVLNTETWNGQGVISVVISWAGIDGRGKVCPICGTSNLGSSTLSGRWLMGIGVATGSSVGTNVKTGGVAEGNKVVFWNNTSSAYSIEFPITITPNTPTVLQFIFDYPNNEVTCIKDFTTFATASSRYLNNFFVRRASNVRFNLFHRAPTESTFTTTSEMFPGSIYEMKIWNAIKEAFDSNNALDNSSYLGLDYQRIYNKYISV